VSVTTALKPKPLLSMMGAAEAATGLVLAVSPAFLVELLLGAAPGTAAGTTVSRVAGVAILAIGGPIVFSCGQGRATPDRQRQMGQHYRPQGNARQPLARPSQHEDRARCSCRSLRRPPRRAPAAFLLHTGAACLDMDTSGQRCCR